MSESNGHKPIKKKLTEKQRKFVKAYVDPNVPSVIKASAIAGYSSKKEGYEALQKPAVIEAVETMREKLQKKLSEIVPHEKVVKAIEIDVNQTEEKAYKARQGGVRLWMDAMEIGKKNEEANTQNNQFIIVLGDNGEKSIGEEII